MMPSSCPPPRSAELARKVKQDLRLLLDNRETHGASIAVPTTTLARWADALSASLLLREQEDRQTRDAWGCPSKETT